MKEAHGAGWEQSNHGDNHLPEYAAILSHKNGNFNSKSGFAGNFVRLTNERGQKGNPLDRNDNVTTDAFAGENIIIDNLLRKW